MNIREQIKTFPARLRAFKVAFISTYLAGNLILCRRMSHSAPQKPIHAVPYLSFKVAFIRPSLPGNLFLCLAMSHHVPQNPIPVVPYLSFDGILKNQNTDQ